MIRNRLAEILFERDIKVVRMAKEIGISRNTIANTASNTSEMLQMNTINKICGFLEITPCDFFHYIPIDIDFSFFEEDKIDLVKSWNLDNLKCKANFDIDMLIDITNKNEQFKIDTKITIKNDILSIIPFDDNKLELTIESTGEQIVKLTELFNEIPKEFKKMIYNNLVTEYKSYLLKNIDEEDKIDSLIKKREIIEGTEITFTNDFLKYY